MGFKNRLMLSLIAIGIVLIMLSGIAAATTYSISLTNGNHTYSAYGPDDYLVLSGSMSGTVTIDCNTNVVLNGVTITQDNNSLNGAFVIGNGFNVMVYLADGTVNIINGSDGRSPNGITGYANSIQGAGKAGIYVPSGSTLIIDSISMNVNSPSLDNVIGNGELKAKGGKGAVSANGDRLAGSGAGIGGRGGYDNSNSRDGTDVGSIIIKNGVITAVGGDSAGNAVGPGRDIGGGSGAYRNNNGAGGYGGSVELIEIKGGTVNTVTYGIGGGHGGDKYGSAGGGNGGSAVIDISGGTIYVDSGYGTLIGGGNGGDSQSGYFNESQGTGGTGSIDIGGDAFVFIPADVDTSNLTGEISAGCNGNDGSIQGTVTGTVGGTINLGNLFSADSAIFYANGGSFGLGSIYSITVSDGMTLSDLSFETFVGPSDNADQLGWFKKEDTTEGVNGIRIAEGNSLPPETVIQKTQKYYMIWTADLTLNPNGGVFYDGADSDEPRTVTVQVGTDWETVNDKIISVTGSNDPSFSSWDFGGWWSSDSGVIDDSADIYWGDASNERNLEDDPILGSETFYAYWNGDITLDANGGEFGNNLFDGTVTIQPGMSYSQLNDAIDEATSSVLQSPWNFQGWYFDCTDGIVANEWTEGGLEPDTTLYAGWFGDIILNANGGTIGNEGTVEVEVQAGQTFGDIDLSDYEIAVHEEGWTGKYWYTDGLGIVETAWESGDSLNVADVLYVGWFGNIILDANGGTIDGEETVEVEVQAGQTFGDIDLSDYEIAVHEEGWAGKYWYTDGLGIVETAWESGDSLNVADVLYVGWFGNIILDANGGTIDGEETVEVEVQAGQIFSNLEIPSPSHDDGWEQFGWYLQIDTDNSMIDGVGLVDFDEILTGDETFDVGDIIYAGWIGQALFIASPGTFGAVEELEFDGGEEFIMSDIQPGENVSGRIPSASYSGHRLAGWLFDDENAWPFFFETNDQMVFADWVQNTGSSGSGTGEARVVDGDASSSGELVDTESTGDEPVTDTPAGFEEEIVPIKKDNTALYLILAAIIILIGVIGGVYYFKVMKKK